MRAIRLHAFGPAGNLVLDDLPDLEPTEGQVRIAVEAARVRTHLTSCAPCRVTEALLRRTVTELAARAIPGCAGAASVRWAFSRRWSELRRD